MVTLTSRRLALLSLVAMAGGLVAADRDPFAGRVAGAPVRCLNTAITLQNPQVLDSHTIVYRDGRRLWRTGPVGECPGLRPMTTMVVQVFGGQICGGDRFQTLDAGTSIPAGPCRFTDFTPYDLPKK